MITHEKTEPIPFLLTKMNRFGFLHQAANECRCNPEVDEER